MIFFNPAQQFFSYYRQACAKRSHAGIAFTQSSKNRFFAPQGRYVAPINVKFDTRSPVSNFTFIGAEMWEYFPKTVKISNFGHKFAPQRSLVCTIFTKFSGIIRVYRYAAFKFLI